MPVPLQSAFRSAIYDYGVKCRHKATDKAVWFCVYDEHCHRTSLAAGGAEGGVRMSRYSSKIVHDNTGSIYRLTLSPVIGTRAPTASRTCASTIRCPWGWPHRGRPAPCRQRASAASPAAPKTLKNFLHLRDTIRTRSRSVPRHARSCIPTAASARTKGLKTPAGFASATMCALLVREMALTEYRLEGESVYLFLFVPSVYRT